MVTAVEAAIPTSPSDDQGVKKEEESEDRRSPLERFRTPPKKPLSVTDLISPAWCELQYFYTLTKHGRKRRTPAMKQGSVVHQVLQDQVHRSVPVETTTREDGWGLRIWNIIQGLKTLRDTGRTRELEVWGVIDGAVVNGVIDELSYECPDRVVDAEAELAKADVRSSSSSSEDAPPGTKALQRTLDDYVKAANNERVHSSMTTNTQRSRKVYITDVKTRASSGALPRNASLRPTLMQLLIYHRLLADLASNAVSPDIIFNRYQLDPSAHFSDSMIAQVGTLQSAHHYQHPPNEDNFEQTPPSTLR